MSDTNSKTLQSYQTQIEKYVAGTRQTVTGAVKEWIDLALQGLPLVAKILEVGSAFGRDAAYIQSKGYAVECTDAVPGFVKLLQEKGLNARQLNLLKDELPPATYDLVLANAVLLHFTSTETEGALRKIAGALRAKGRFAFSLKRGEGQDWSSAKLDAPRFFQYWTRAAIEEVVMRNSLKILHLDENGAGHDSGEWLHLIVSKS